MPPTLLDTPRSLPNIAVITLPPATTLPQFVSLQGSQVTTAIVVAVAFGVLICDFLHLFPLEMKLYHTSRKALWSSPATWSFVLLQCSGILAIFPALFLIFVQNKYCQGVVASSQVGVVLVVASSGLIFSFRVIAMWDGHNVVRAIVGIMYVAMVTCWCAVVSQYRTVTDPPAPFGSNCHLRPFVSWTPIASASSVAFDTVVLLLAAFKLPSTSASSSPAETTIHRNSLVCLFITAFANVIVLVIQSLSPSLNHIKPTAVPISILITVMMGARVYLHIQQLRWPEGSRRQTRIEQVLPITSIDNRRGAGTYTNPVIPAQSLSGDSTPQNDVPKAYPIDLSSLDVPRPDTPFGSYDYETSKDMTRFPRTVFTRETVVTVE